MLIVAKSGPIPSPCPFGLNAEPISARESELIRGNERLGHPYLAVSRTRCRRVGGTLVLTLAPSLANSFVSPLH